MIPTLLLSTATIVLGAQSPKPGGWVAIVLGVAAILATTLHLR